jgi:hypothetical protein
MRAADAVPIRRLRDEFGVTHLLVERERLVRPTHYFKPFGPMIEGAFALGNQAGFEVDRLRPTATVYEEDAYFILDLMRVP